MYAKYFIHTRFTLSKEASAEIFVNYYKHVLMVEREKYVEKCDKNTFKNRFGKLLPAF